MARRRTIRTGRYIHPFYISSEVANADGGAFDHCLNLHNATIMAHHAKVQSVIGSAGVEYAGSGADKMRWEAELHCIGNEAEAHRGLVVTGDDRSFRIQTFSVQFRRDDWVDWEDPYPINPVIEVCLRR